MKVKVCTKCKVEQPLSEYHKSSQSKDGLHPHCKVCKLAWRDKRPEETVGYHLMRKYGITLAQYDELFEAQKGLCAICGCPESRTTTAGASRRLAVDHDHSCCPGQNSCGKCIRQLLCFRCNSTLGRVHDNPALLESMAAYLREHGATDPDESITF